MTRLRCIVALVRVLLVALCLCLLGAARPDTVPDVAGASIGPQPAHADSVDLPDPGAALTEERDEDPRDSEAGDARPPMRPGFGPPSTPPRRAIMARGPPSDPRVEGRPRSSRGPPAQV